MLCTANLCTAWKADVQVYLNSRNSHAPNVVRGHFYNSAQILTTWEAGYLKEPRGEFFCKESFCNAINYPLMYLFCKFGFLYIRFTLSFSPEVFWAVVITCQTTLPIHKVDDQGMASQISPDELCGGNCSQDAARSCRGWKQAYCCQHCLNCLHVLDKEKQRIVACGEMKQSSC